MSTPTETSPLNAAKRLARDAEKDAKAQANDIEKEGIRSYAKDQVKDVEEEGFHGYLGSFICCRMVAPISFPALQNKRQQVLSIAHYLCAFALFLSFLSFWGGFSWGNTLSYLPWVTVVGPEGKGYAGVKWVCWDLPSPPAEGTFGDGQGAYGDGHGSFWRCETWATFDCAEFTVGVDQCKMCKNQAHAIMFSVFMAVFTFYSFYKKTNERQDGNDSNFTKFMACFSALLGGTNFAIAMLTYWNYCVFSAGALSLQVRSGPGLIFMIVAAVLKVFMGLVHLGLPVENSEKKSDA